MTLHLTARQALEELIDDLVHASPAVAVLFTGTSCHLSDEVEPHVGALLRERFPLIRYAVVSRSDAPRLVAQLGIVDTPTLVVWFAGEEAARFVGDFVPHAIAEAVEPPYVRHFSH